MEGLTDWEIEAEEQEEHGCADADGAGDTDPVLLGLALDPQRSGAGHHAQATERLRVTSTQSGLGVKATTAQAA